MLVFGLGCLPNVDVFSHVFKVDYVSPPQGVSWTLSPRHGPCFGVARGYSNALAGRLLPRAWRTDNVLFQTLVRHVEEGPSLPLVTDVASTHKVT